MIDYTPDEKLINGAAQQLQLMLETSPYSPAECLRRVFAPILEQIRADVKAAGLSVPPTISTKQIRDTIRLAIAEDDAGAYDYQDESGEVGLSNKDVDRLADVAALAIEDFCHVTPRVRARRTASEQETTTTTHKT